MRRSDCLRVMADLVTDQLVVCNLGGTSEDWWDVNPRRDENTFYMRSSMGLVSSMALGLALALPARRVWALDGDGSLAMNLGTLLTTARIAPHNLLHVVWLNRAYEATGAQPLPLADSADLCAMARGAGISSVHALDEIDDFRQKMPGLLLLETHTFIVASVEAVDATQRERRVSFPIEMAQRFGQHIESTEGIQVFAP